MSAKQTRAVAVFIILLGIAIAVILIVRAQERSSSEPVNGNRDIATTGRVRTLAEAGKADFISIILYEGANPAVSYMAGSGTEEFDALTEAMEQAAPVAGGSDETFADLLVLSFGRGDTLNVVYSTRRNLLMVEDQMYQPSVDMQQIIDQVQIRTDEPN